MRPRYDGNADWYERAIAWSTAAAAPLLGRLSGPGPGRCLDLGCGTGVHLAGLVNAGWSVIGVDASADQLRLARQRAGQVTPLVQGDAARLPFPPSSFTLVMSAFTHTDVEDFTALAAEARRVLEPDGRFVYVGLHPCFKGPFAEQPRADGARVFHPDYRQAGWRASGPGSSGVGLTSRVGFRHLPVADLLNCVLRGWSSTHSPGGGRHWRPARVASIDRAALTRAARPTPRNCGPDAHVRPARPAQCTALKRV